MQHYCHSDDDNYLRLSNQGASSSSSHAGPQPYNKSYPLHEHPTTHGGKKAAVVVSPGMSGTPSATSSNSYTKTKNYNYPEVSLVPAPKFNDVVVPQPYMSPHAAGGFGQASKKPVHLALHNVSAAMQSAPYQMQPQLSPYPYSAPIAGVFPPTPTGTNTPMGVVPPPAGFLGPSQAPNGGLVQSPTIPAYRPTNYRMSKHSRPSQNLSSHHSHPMYPNMPLPPPSNYPHAPQLQYQFQQQSQSAPISPSSVPSHTYVAGTPPLMSPQQLLPPTAHQQHKHQQRPLHRKHSFAQPPQGPQMTPVSNNIMQSMGPPPPPHQPSRPENDTLAVAAVAAYKNTERMQVVYLRNWERQCERSKFTTLFHCLEPVKLVSKTKKQLKLQSSSPAKGNLHPLFKASEDWIAPTVGLRLDNKPGYRCILYIVDGTLLHDNGLGGEKLLSKGMVLMTTTKRDVVTYVRNPSKTHRVHIIRLWMDMDDFGQPDRTSGKKQGKKQGAGAGGIAVEPTKRQQRDGDSAGTSNVMHADFHCKVRHVADSDKENYLLVLAQPSNYLPSYGLTSLIYGPVEPNRRQEGNGDVPDAGNANVEEDYDEGRTDMLSLEKSYAMSKTALAKRPSYFTPESMVDLHQSMGELTGDWEETDPQLTSRVCVDPFIVDEDIFVALCSLEPGARVTHEPYDLHDNRRAKENKHKNPLRGVRRRLWIQSLLSDLNPEASTNGGRLMINGDMANRMRPGDSAYVRRVELTDKVVLENCGRTPMEFIVAETPY
ncbi:hypothetical protein LPJ59_000018 [Coemansia sp. RSA 2399]|nr:hypothetical protein LPJ59_000018 [Coemansia sp. RSA 2399]KAJ1908517.1 hypothetical protein LPJ81_000018 [Coemansia sp. IMI 209127]